MVVSYFTATQYFQMSNSEKTKADWDNKSNQCNPNNEEYSGHDKKYPGERNQA